MTGSRQTIGRLGEDLAAAELISRGYTILARNYRLRRGEIDIVARRGRVLVFAEVKTRRSSLYGSALEAVTVKKQQTISRLAEEYLSREGAHGAPVSFMVVAVTLSANGKARIEIVDNAFEASS